MLGRERKYKKALSTIGILLSLYVICFLGIDNVCASQIEKGKVLSGCLLDDSKVLSLGECVRFAIKNSFDVKLARLDFLIAGTDLNLAEAVFDTFMIGEVKYKEDRQRDLSIFGADLTQTNKYSAGISKKLPSGTKFDVSLSDERSWTNSEYVSENPSHMTEFSVEARQPLGKNFFGYIDRGNVTVTRLSIQNDDLDTKERIEKVITDVEKAYWQWVFFKESLEIYKEMLKRAKRLLVINEKNFDTGRIEKADLLASQANVLMRKKDVRIAENKYRNAEERIKFLMNMDADDRVYPEENLRRKEMDVSLEECLKRAFITRRDYKDARREVEIKNIVLRTKKSAKLPKIDLVASMIANGIDSSIDEAMDKMIEENNTEYYAGLEISVPIENNEARGEFEKASRNKEKALVGLKKVERTIITEVGDDFRDYITYKTTLDTVIEAARLQGEKLKEEEARFNYGRSNTKTLIDYQQDYLTARLDVASGLIDLAIARVNLEKTLNIILLKYEELL